MNEDYYTLPHFRELDDENQLTIPRAQALLTAVRRQRDYSVRQLLQTEDGACECIVVDVETDGVPKNNRHGIRERLINSRFHEAICFSVDQDGPSAGNPLVRERLSRIPPPSGGPRPVRTPVR